MITIDKIVNLVNFTSFPLEFDKVAPFFDLGKIFVGKEEEKQRLKEKEGK